MLFRPGRIRGARGGRERGRFCWLGSGRRPGRVCRAGGGSRFERAGWQRCLRGSGRQRGDDRRRQADGGAHERRGGIGNGGRRTQCRLRGRWFALHCKAANRFPVQPHEDLHLVISRQPCAGVGGPFCKTVATRRTVPGGGLVMDQRCASIP